MQTKFIHIEDDTAVLFAANGTPLLAVMAAFADIVPLEQFSLPILPMWLYLLGLIFIFVSKIIIQTFNDDMRQRERLQNGRDIFLETLSREDIPDDFRRQTEIQLESLNAFSDKLLKIKTVNALTRWRAICFLFSGICFLVSSFILIAEASSVLSIKHQTSETGIRTSANVNISTSPHGQAD